MDTEALSPCPLCGANEGYTLYAGNDYRWWLAQCSVCGDHALECHADRTAKFDAPKPKRWKFADDAWNSAAAYTESLRIYAMRYDKLRNLSKQQLLDLINHKSIDEADYFDQLVDELK